MERQNRWPMHCNRASARSISRALTALSSTLTPRALHAGQFTVVDSVTGSTLEQQSLITVSNSINPGVWSRVKGPNWRVSGPLPAGSDPLRL